jgi:hypothetical protein
MKLSPFRVLSLSAALAVAAAPACSVFESHPAIGADTAACGECVGADVLSNYTSAAPLAFYPALTSKLVADCGAKCGSDLADVISAVAGSQDPKVQATPAYPEARARRAAMLAPTAK